MSDAGETRPPTWIAVCAGAGWQGATHRLQRGALDADVLHGELCAHDSYGRGAVKPTGSERNGAPRFPLEYSGMRSRSS